jgi:3-oxoacyl-[acyl-carrier protein] reductase
MPTEVRYEIVKAGTIALTRALARQLAPSGTNVDCIVPGYIRGIRPLKIEKSLGLDLLQTIPSGRLGEVFDVAETVLFAIRDESKYITGQIFHVTGGK